DTTIIIAKICLNSFIGLTPLYYVNNYLLECVSILILFVFHFDQNEFKGIISGIFGQMFSCRCPQGRARFWSILLSRSVRESEFTFQISQEYCKSIGMV